MIIPYFFSVIQDYIHSFLSSYTDPIKTTIFTYELSLNQYVPYLGNKANLVFDLIFSLVKPEFQERNM